MLHLHAGDRSTVSLFRKEEVSGVAGPGGSLLFCNMAIIKEIAFTLVTNADPFELT